MTIAREGAGRMDQQMGFLLETLLIPAVAAGVLALARKNLGRAILALSITALGAAFARVALAIVESGYAAYSVYGGQPDYAHAAPYLALSWLRSTTFGLALVVSIVAWALSLYDAVLRRSWAWFAAILSCACLSYAAATVWSYATFMERDPLFALLLRGSPWIAYFILSTLAAVSAMVTTIYASLMPRAPALWMPLPYAYAPPMAYVPTMMPSAGVQMPAPPPTLRPEPGASS